MPNISKFALALRLRLSSLWVTGRYPAAWNSAILTPSESPSWGVASSAREAAPALTSKLDQIQCSSFSVRCALQSHLQNMSQGKPTVAHGTPRLWSQPRDRQCLPVKHGPTIRHGTTQAGKLACKFVFGLGKSFGSTLKLLPDLHGAEWLLT